MGGFESNQDILGGKMSRIAYARVSSVGQSLSRQIDSLEAAGFDKLFTEKISGRKMDRPELQKMLDYIRENDQIVVHSISRLARSNRDLHNLVHFITVEKKCQLIFLKEGINTSTPAGQMMLGILGAIVQFEVENSKERQAEGILAAKKRNVKFGRPKKELPENFAKVVQSWREGEIKAVDAIKELNISKSRFYALVR